MEAAWSALVRGEQQGPLAALQRAGLWALSLPYALAVRGRNWAFDRGWKASTRAPVPVISVGNLTVGGTGKTPCVEYVARLLRRHDLRVAILSRGFGATEGRNDEARVLEENLPDVPHLQGADRVHLAQIAVDELESEVLVLDDGFQHRRLARTLDLVLVDATQPWGYEYVLPRGLLREPRRGLRRAHLVLLTRCDLVAPQARAQLREDIAALAPKALVAESVHRPVAWRNARGTEMEVEDLRGKTVAAFCGLGNPEAFRQTLAQLGVQLAGWRTFRDHHDYTAQDLDELRGWIAAQSVDAVVTSQKDLVKINLEVLGERPLWALRIALEVTQGREALEHAVLTAAKSAD